MTFEFSQTFNDGDTLTAYNSTTFPVTYSQIQSSPQLIQPVGGALTNVESYSNAEPCLSCQSGGTSASAPTSPGQVSKNDPVNTATGDFHDSVVDIRVPGAGIPLSFQRTYDSDLAQQEMESGSPPESMGYGWAYNFGMNVAYNSSTGIATVTEEDGAKVSFQSDTKGTPAWCPSTTNFCPTAPRVIATLNQNADGTWTFVDAETGRTTITFSSGGQLSAIANSTGDTVTAATQTPGTGQCPTSATTCAEWTSSASGRSLTLAYDTSSRLLSVTDSSGNSASFCYYGQTCAPQSGGSSSDLASVTDPGGLTTSFSYDTTNTNPDLVHDVVNETTPNGGTVANTWDSNGRVISQTDPQGTATFAYSGTNSSYNGGSTTVTQYPDGTGSGQPTDVTQYVYSSGVLIAETDGYGSSNGATTYYDRDPKTLLATVIQDANGGASTAAVNSAAGGTAALAAANIDSSSDPLGNTTLRAYTTDNLLWCSVSPAEALAGVTCPATEPTTPPAPGSSDPNLGATINYFDSQDQLTATTDPLGNTTTYSYTAAGGSVPDGLVYCTVQPAAYQQGTSCPSYGASHTAATSTAAFDAAGDLLTSTDPAGNVTTYTYDPALPGKIASTTSPDGSTTTYTYNPAGQPTDTTVSFKEYSASTLQAYDTAGRLYCTVDPPASSQGVQCPTSPPSINSPPAGLTSTFYDSDNRPVLVVGPTGATTQDAYDSAGSEYCTVAATAYAAGTRCPTQPPSTAPTVGNDPYLGTTIYTYDNEGRPVQATNPLGGITLSSYDADGNVTQVVKESDNPTNAPSVTTSNTYDADGNLASSTVAPGTSVASTTLSSFDPDGHKYCSVSPDVYAKGSSGYTCPIWQASWIVVPPNPAALYPTTANSVSTWFYDADGDLRQSTGPGGASNVTAYDPDNRPYCASVAADATAWLDVNTTATYPYMCPAAAPASPPTGIATTYETKIYDLDGHLSSDTNPLGDTTTNTYDPAGQTLTTTDPNGNATTHCYYWETTSCATSAPAAGGTGEDLYSTTTPPTAADPNGQATTYTYLPGGKQSTATSPAGTATTTYDLAGDMTGLQYGAPSPGYSASPGVSYTYNPDGSKQTMTDGSGTTNFGYDLSGDTTSETFTPAPGSNTTAYTVKYSYFATGQLASTTYPAVTGYQTPTVSRTYDQDGNLASVSDWLGKTTTFSYDPDGNLLTQAAPNGTTTSITSDLSDAVTSVSLAPTSAPNSPLAGISYQRNSAEQITSEADSGALSGTTNLIYNAADQLAQLAGNTSYDKAGNPTNPGYGTTQTFDAADELTATNQPSNTTTVTNDTLGDRTQQNTTGGATTNYSYNQAGQLTSVAPQPFAPSLASGSQDSYVLRQDGTVWASGDNSVGELGNGTTKNSTAMTEVSGLTNVTAVAAGTQTAYALRNDGTVWAWGLNSSYQLGNGTTTNATTATQVPGLSGIKAISAGSSFAVALGSNGTIYEWGSNSAGQIGNNTTTTAQTPTQVTTLAGVAAISAGTATAYALTSSGTVYDWGLNSNYQLGNGTTTNSLTPIQVPGLTGITQIAGGDSHAVALSQAGTVEAWGLNTSGQVGNNTTTTAQTPTAVSGLTGIATIAAIGDTSFASNSAGSAWAWGLNTSGQVGNNTTTNQLTPTTIPGILAAAVGQGPSGASAVLEQSDGTSWAWGLNNHGQLGNNSTTNELTPRQVNGIRTPLAAGGQNIEVLGKDGTVWTAGDDSDGQLGNGGTAASNDLVQVPDIGGITAVATGADTEYALTSSGKVLAWGLDSSGQIGNGTTTNTNTPVPVSGLSNITAVSAGASHALALKADGTVWAWGLNSSGELGNGTTTNATTPVQVPGLTGITAIAAGGSTSYAVTSAGAVYAWGSNSSYQVGNSSTRNASSPIQLSTPTGVVQITAGASHVLALTASGAVYGWGDNSYGELGNGSTKVGKTPAQITALSNITAIAANADTSYARTATGALQAWGANTNGQLGNNSKTNATTPTTISGVTVESLADGPGNSSGAGGETIVDQPSGNLYAWGANSSGQLGTGTYTDTLVPTPGTKIGPASESFTYNGYGLRVSSTQAGTTTTYVYDTSGNVPKILSDGINSYIYGPNGQPVEDITGGNTALYTSDDQTTSVRLITNSSGAVAGSATYDAEGRIIAKTGSAAVPIGYAGAYTDPTGLLYMMYRYYDPTSDLFLTVDPDLSTTQQPYTYANENPIDNSDPTGLCLICILDPWSHANPLYVDAKHHNGIAQAVETYDPAYHAINDAYDAYQAAQSSCSSNWTIAKDSAAALLWSAATVASATGPVDGAAAAATGGEEDAGAAARSLGLDPATGAFRQSEYDTAIRIQQERGVALTRSADPSVDWVDSNGSTYDAVGNFSSKFFDQQWPNLQTRILDHVGKADFVPVDVSGFTPQQVAQVQQFIDPLGPSVFLVGQ